MRSGRRWMLRSRLRTMASSSVEGGGGVVAEAAFHAGPGALDGVEVGGVAGQVDHGEPVGVGLGELRASSGCGGC